MNLDEIFTQERFDKGFVLKRAGEFSHDYNESLPEDYIEFLTHFNNSSLRSSKFLVTRSFEDGFEQSFYLEEIFSIDKTIEYYRLFFIAHPEPGLVDASVIPIAKLEGRTYICLGIGLINQGQIFLWDGDFGVTKQAETLMKFFNSLVVDEV